MSSNLGVIIAPIVAIVGGSLLKLSASRSPRHQGGWTSLSPGLGLYGMGILALGITGLFVFLLFDFLVSPAFRAAFIQSGNSFGGLLFVAIGLGGIGLYMATFIFLIHLRFNDEGIERRFLGRVQNCTWKEVAEINRHWFFGPQVQLKSGGSITVWEYLKGYPDLLAAARARGIPVSAERGRRTP